MFDIIDPLVSSIVLALWGLAFGGFIGAIIGVIGYAATGGRRDFTSAGTMRAQQYNIMVDAEVADEAQRLLSRLSS